MPDHCPHFSTGFCSVCRALDQALAELQRVRGQRDRLVEAIKGLAERCDALCEHAKKHHGDSLEPFRQGRTAAMARQALMDADIAAQP